MIWQNCSSWYIGIETAIDAFSMSVTVCKDKWFVINFNNNFRLWSGWDWLSLLLSPFDGLCITTPGVLFPGFWRESKSQTTVRPLDRSVSFDYLIKNGDDTETNLRVVPRRRLKIEEMKYLKITRFLNTQRQMSVPSLW
jgi:hypothetical protein